MAIRPSTPFTRPNSAAASTVASGDPRCKIYIVMLQTNPDGPVHQRQSQILVPMDAPGLEILGPMNVFGGMLPF